VADRFLLMEKGEILEHGAPEHFFTAPTLERTKEFLGQIL